MGLVHGGGRNADALRDGTIAGATLDTHYAYPLPPEHPLWHFPNVIITPHISGSNLSPHFKTRLWDIVYENARRFVSGEPLLTELAQDPLRGYGTWAYFCSNTSRHFRDSSSLKPM